MIHTFVSFFGYCLNPPQFPMGGARAHFPKSGWKSNQMDMEVYLGVRTCELFLCFVPFVFLGFIVLSCFVCFTSPVSLTGSYTEDEPDIVIDILTKSVEMRTNFRAKTQFAKSLLVLKLLTKFQILSHTNLIPRTP